MKDLAKMIANTNEKSLSEMVDSLNKFEEKPLKVVDLESDIANLKKKIVSQEPLFTLTAEEVEMEEQIIGAALYAYRKLYNAHKETCIANDFKEAMDYCHKQLKRIKQWKYENKNSE